MKTPFVDHDLCTGCGVCEETCPEVFEMNADGLATVKDPAGAPEEKVQEAINDCPVEAISWKQ
jgi:ferredoxin